MRKLLIALSLLFLLSASVISLMAADAEFIPRPPSSVQLSLVSQPIQLKESVRDEGIFITFDSKNPLAGQTGMPALPVVRQLVAIPAAAAPEVDVALSKAQALSTLTHPLEPVPAYSPVIDSNSMHHLGDYLQAEYQINQARYRRNEWYPKELVQVSAPMTLRGQTMVRVEFTPVQVNLATGQLRWFSSADVTLSWQANALPRSFAVPEDPHFEATFAGILSNYESARNWRTPRQPASTSVRRFGAQDSWMIMLEGKGLFKIPLSDLESAGVDLSNPDRLAVYYGSGEETQEQALWIDDENLYLLNTRDHGRWSKKIVYRLQVLTSGTGLRMPELSSPANQPTTTSQVPYELRFEEDMVYMPKDSSTRPNERWMWNRFFVLPNVIPSEMFTVSFDLPHLAPLSSAQVSSELGPEHTPYSGRCYQAELFVNNQRVLKTWHDRFEGFDEVLNVPANDLLSSGNTYRIEQQACGTVSTLEFNAFTVNYERLLIADNDELWFDNEGNSGFNYNLSNFTTQHIVAFDVTSPNIPQRIKQETITGNGPYSFSFGRPATPNERYFVTTLEEAQTVERITLYQDQGLRSDLRQTDYLIISHPEFIDTLQPLIEARQAQGLSTRVVSTLDIYNDFGFGTLDPEAIRKFIKYGYQNWQGPALSYVLLVGDGHYDPLNILGQQEPIWLPPMLLVKDYYLGEVPADNGFVSGLDPNESIDTPLADVYLGRLPANSAEQAAAMVQKIIAYENNEYYNWRRNILFTSDNPDAAGDFYHLSDHLTDIPGGLDLIPARINVEKAYLYQDDTPYQSDLSVRDKILESMNDGQLIIQYIGHSARTQWAGSSGIWSVNRGGVSDVSLLEPNTRLPFSLPWTCWAGYFVTPDTESVSEAMMRLPNAGAIASFAPTGLDVATGHDYMTVALYQALFRDETPTTQLGPLALRAKMGLTGSYQRMWYTYMLYGDPAMNLLVDPCIYDENMSCAEDAHLYLPNVSH